MKKLPESEQEIMMIIWEYEEPVSRFQVEEKLNVEKNVAPSTILTLLTRLEKKGFIQKVRNGKSHQHILGGVQRAGKHPAALHRP